MILLPRPPVKQGRNWEGRQIDRTVCNATRSLRNKLGWLQAIKMATGCEEPACQWIGSFTPEQLAFDHLDPACKHPKLINGSAKIHSLSWADIEQELKKCRVICHNCHARHTVVSGHHR